MSKNRIITFAILLVASMANAQPYVTIPDPNFVAWLQAHYPTCMSGNQMNTTCPEIQNAIAVNVSGLGISDLTGIEHFISLDTLFCNNNQLTSLPQLPLSLLFLGCDNNQLTTLPTLPPTLISLFCKINQLTNLPPLPSTLVKLDCRINQLTSLPFLGSPLQHLLCSFNQLTSLPPLPSSLELLFCDSNQLTNLPPLPPSFSVLYCDFNQLTNLPQLPATLESLVCSNNQLTTLPELPAWLYHLDCHNNNISCFPPFPNAFGGPEYFDLSANPFSCLPNYIYVMGVGLGTGPNYLSFPLCATGDPLNNPSGCASANGVYGHTYSDLNADCAWNAGDGDLMNIPIKLYDASNNLIGQTNTYGVYQFPVGDGNYTVVIDTVGMPFSVQCQFPGIDSTLVLSSTEPLAQIDFDIFCDPGLTDVGVQAVTPFGWVFPGQQHGVNISAGDFVCPSSTNGTMTVTIMGPVTYAGVNGAAIVPAVSGNVLTYDVADFGNSNLGQLFSFLLTTDNTAQVGDSVCISVTITTSVLDSDPSNNTLHFCYPVVNSYDPNMKEVSPGNVSPGYNDWFTYTLHFQNTGNAPAFNIRLLDTLDTDLDLGSFEMLTYSHPSTYSIMGNRLTVHFPNIMLPDSTEDEMGSHGYFQYRIKPRTNLPEGTQIKNTCHIYFDFNEPITTNTTINDFTLTLPEQFSGRSVKLYPNPTSGQFRIETPWAHSLITVYDVTGSVISSMASNTSFSNINLESHTSGLYLVQVSSGSGVWHGKVVRE